MERIALEVEGCQLGVGHLDAFLVGVGVEFTADGQAGLGRRAGDEVDHDKAAGERRRTPVLRDVTEQAVLDLVPLCALPRCTDDVGANPTRQLSLQPEAPGADQEATNGLMWTALGRSIWPYSEWVARRTRTFFSLARQNAAPCSTPRGERARRLAGALLAPTPPESHGA